MACSGLKVGSPGAPVPFGHGSNGIGRGVGGWERVADREGVDQVVLVRQAARSVLPRPLVDVLRILLAAPGEDGGIVRGPIADEVRLSTTLRLLPGPVVVRRRAAPGYPTTGDLVTDLVPVVYSCGLVGKSQAFPVSPRPHPTGTGHCRARPAGSPAPAPTASASVSITAQRSLECPLPCRQRSSSHLSASRIPIPPVIRPPPD